MGEVGRGRRRFVLVAVLLPGADLGWVPGSAAKFRARFSFLSGFDGVFGVIFGLRGVREGENVSCRLPGGEGVGGGLAVFEVLKGLWVVLFLVERVRWVLLVLCRWISRVVGVGFRDRRLFLERGFRFCWGLRGAFWVFWVWGGGGRGKRLVGGYGGVMRPIEQVQVWALTRLANVEVWPDWPQDPGDIWRLELTSLESECSLSVLWRPGVGLEIARSDRSLGELKHEESDLEGLWARVLEGLGQPEAGFDPAISAVSSSCCGLRELRARAQISQSELARRLGVTRPAVTLMEGGDLERMSIGRARAAVEALGGEMAICVTGLGKPVLLTYEPRSIADLSALKR